jgi:IS30 family transposase
MRGIVFYVGAISMFLSVDVINAQTPPRSDPRSVVIETNRQELDTLLLRKPILTAEDNSARQAVLKQINEDFKALQVLNNRLMTEATSTVEVNYKSLSKLLSEIGSKASRLKSNLRLPKVDIEKREERKMRLDAAGFRVALEAFDKVVINFATNPIFQRINVVEMDLAKQASRDLSTIIDQSRKLKKSATTLEAKAP